MSKPPLRAVLPRSHARARARALYGAPFTTFHHVHLDAGAVPPMPPPRGGSSSAPTPRLTSTQSVSSPTTQSQPDALSLLFDVSAFQPGSHSTPNSSQSMFGSGSTQIAGPPPPGPPPPVQNSAPAQHGARLFPLPPPSSPLPASLAALPAMSHYQQLLGSVTAGMPVPASTKKSRAHFALESAAYGIPKHRSRGLSSGPIASSSFGAASSRTTLPDTGTDMSVQVGEDAYFLLPNALGVSDGVGGWSQRSRSQSPSSTPSGPSASALFSRRLMHFCADEISALGPLPEAWSSLPSSGATSTAPANPGHPPVPVPSQAGLLNPTAAAAPNPASQDSQNTDLLEPIAVLQRAHARAVALSRADHSVCGSSTALLAVLLGDELRVAHLGDCALCLVRDGKMVFRSEEQQWKFNHPLQLGPFSSTVPGDAQRIALKVQPDDILILSSDGMSDNLWDEDVLDEVKKFTSQRQGSPTGAAAIIRKHAMPSMLSEALCSRAKRASEVRPQRSQDDSALPDPTSGAEFGNEVPFARRAREEGIKFSGGKADDISVLVAVISSQAESTRTPKDPAPTGPPNGSSLQSNLTLLTSWSSR